MLKLIQIIRIEFTFKLVGRLQHTDKRLIATEDRHGQPASHWRVFQASVVLQIAKPFPGRMSSQFLVCHAATSSAGSQHSPDSFPGRHHIIGKVLFVFVRQRNRMDSRFEPATRQITQSRLMCSNDQPNLLDENIQCLFDRTAFVRTGQRPSEAANNGRTVVRFRCIS